jgi:hypothetical protein
VLGCNICCLETGNECQMRLPTLAIRLKTGNEGPGPTLVDAGIPD